MQKRKITIKSGGEEFQMEVTVEEYRIYYRPWWQKKEQRNREAMEENEYMKSLMRGGKMAYWMNRWIWNIRRKVWRKS